MQKSPPEEYHIAWNLFVELRKETLESQKIRAQVIGFKITFISTGIGIILSQQGKIPSTLLLIPAFAAIFFDLLIVSYSFSIKRIGHYCRKYLEPKIRTSCGLPVDFLLWQEFLKNLKTRQYFSQIGNVGITCLALIPATLALWKPFDPFICVPLMSVLFCLFVYDVWSHFSVWKFHGEI